MHSASPARLTLAVVVGIVTLQALMLMAFAWPAANVGPVSCRSRLRAHRSGDEGR
jgi:hypothetical protein